MQVYSEVNKELKNINFEIVQTISMPITKGATLEGYEESIKGLIVKVKVLRAKQNTILAELDLLFAEDELKYERGLKLWLSAINTAFEKVCFNFQDETLTPDIVNNDTNFFQRFMQIINKIDYESGKHKLTISECGLFYGYVLYNIKNSIIDRRFELKKNDTTPSKIELTFFRNIAHQLYTYNYKVGAVDFFNFRDFIEAKHTTIDFKGKIFYLNLINAMPVVGERLAHETRGEVPTYKEKIFKDVLGYCNQKIIEIDSGLTSSQFPKIKPSFMEQGELRMVTTFDRISRELDIIDNIFKAQYKKYDATNLFAYPTILDNKGKSGIDGRYISGIDFYSDVELFSIQSYKSEFTQRFETANDNTLIKNQLLELKDRVTDVRDYYNKYLTNKNEIVIDFLKTGKLPYDQRFEKMADHSVCITISNYYIMEIYFGCDRSNTNGLIKDYPFTYISDNNFLATICQSIIDFIDKFELSRRTSTGERLDLATIFSERNNSFEVCEGLLEDLGITIGGKPNTKKGRIGRLTGAINAIRGTPGMLKSDFTEMKLLDYFNAYLQTDYKTFSKRSKGYDEGFDDAKRYINNNFKK